MQPLEKKRLAMQHLRSKLEQHGRFKGKYEEVSQFGGEDLA